jgi:hypothetical protein
MHARQYARHLKRATVFAAFCLGVASLAGACGASPTVPTMAQGSTIRAGTWGGEHIGLQASTTGASLDYDCAHGTIEHAMTLDSRGRFDLRGRHVVERGGPVREDDDQAGRPASYVGSVVGDVMMLTVTFTDTGERVGIFSLTFGKSPVVRKCL